MDQGLVAEEGPSSIIDKPKTERMKEFLSSIND
jgi:ABC-type histidine transport system ATPase subunit